MWLILLLAFSLTHAPPEPLELAVSPHVCLAPCDVRVVIRVIPHPENRGVWLSVDGTGSPVSLSWFELNGDHAPATQPPRWFTALGEGTYVVEVQLISTSGFVMARKEKVEVGR